MWKSHGPHSTRAAQDARCDQEVRRLLQAAAARPDELPALSPFLAGRVRAAAGHPPSPAHPLAAVALHALPALAALLAVISAWAVFETVRSTDPGDDAAMVVLASREGATDAPLATMFLSGGGEEHAAGGAR